MKNTKKKKKKKKILLRSLPIKKNKKIYKNQIKFLKMTTYSTNTKKNK